MLLFFLPSVAVADFVCPENIESKCATIKMVIYQEAAFERQAFDAAMKIENGVDRALEDVEIQVVFTDQYGNEVTASSDPEDTSALFFIRVEFMENITGTTGEGVVNPSANATIHWLIIPAPGASENMGNGTPYYVGARLHYSLGGDTNIIIVPPERIFVLPMPKLTLDYFLPKYVVGDDPFTEETEPPVPFSLGLRLANNGFGTAKNLTIESSRPEIVENEQGLLIDFTVLDAEINGKTTDANLILECGDVGPMGLILARWTLQCSLSGEFKAFSASFSHADELGGRMTSLIENANTHYLVRDVLVDIPGRDRIRDFLIKDNSAYKLYESENISCSEVQDLSSVSGLSPDNQTGSETVFTLSTGAADSFVFIGLPDPFSGTNTVVNALRSDGKQVKPENIWLSKNQKEDHSWEYFINLFDAGSTGAYTVAFQDTGTGNPPVLEPIDDQSGSEGCELVFNVRANDPDGTYPALTASPLPSGAVFTDNGNGEAVFAWTPATGQAGNHSVTITASDGILSDSQAVLLTILPAQDTDGDGMADAWEMAYFGTLARDGTGDYDGDGISDLKEYLNGTNPVLCNAPSVPKIVVPADGQEVTELSPIFAVENSTDPDGDTVTYEFEIFADSQMTIPVETQTNIVETPSETSWSVSEPLLDNTWYFWRVRATDGIGFSMWAYGSFFANTQNDPPEDFFISSPADGTDVDTINPVLVVTNSIDVDGDQVAYIFEIYEDANLSNLVAVSDGILAGENGDTSWTVADPLSDNTLYYWRAISLDEHGAMTMTAPASFFVNLENDAPPAPAIVSPPLHGEVQTTDPDLVVENAGDVDGDPLYYFFELDEVNTFGSPYLRQSGPVDQGEDTTAWTLTGLNDNMRYFWRARASDGMADSLWTASDFFVNTQNDPPSTPVFKNPGDKAWIDTLSPKLSLHPAWDPDNDVLSYRFELYSDPLLQTFLDGGVSDVPEWVVACELSDNQWYYWRSKTVDEHSEQSSWTNTASFFTDTNGLNDPPVISITCPATNLTTNSNSFTLQWQDADPDSNARISLFYDTDDKGFDGVLIESDIPEDPDDSGDSYAWDITGLEGTFYVYAQISDHYSQENVYAPGAVIPDRTVPMISATPPSGEYDTGLSVVLSCDKNVDIYFTTDGSEPSIESQRYQSPVIITETIVIKFMAVDNAGNQSQTVEAWYVIVPPNIAPVADAGPDLRVFPGKTAILDGSGSDDPDDGPSSLVFSWIFIDKPSESNLSDTSIIGSDTIAPEFVPDVPGTYELQLTVHDGADIASDSAKVVCEPSILGDLDADGDVDGIDRNIVRSALGKCFGDVGYVAEADYDRNGCIREKDYRLWLNSFVSYVCNNACSVYIKADLNMDGKVDYKDLLIILRSREKCEGHPYFVSEADYNANGCIDHWDYIEWMAYNGAKLICLY
jgi:hypothetical protein